MWRTRGLVRQHSFGGWLLRVSATKLRLWPICPGRPKENVMPFLNQIIDGSLLSGDRLLRAREFYSPIDKRLPTQVAFARWTQRVSMQSALGAARELAGLSDQELAELEAEFIRCPMRQQSRWIGHAVVSGGVLIVLACIGFGLEALAKLGDTGARALLMMSVVCLLAGMACLSSALVSAFSTMNAALSHGTTGLYVGRLDEQHPWLYRAISLTRYHVAEDYRQRTLRERGTLRGADFVMMRELVEVQEAREQVRPSRSVAAQLQFLPLAVEAMAQEPRLVRVGPGREQSPAAPRGPFGIEGRLVGS